MAGFSLRRKNNDHQADGQRSRKGLADNSRSPTFSYYSQRKQTQRSLSNDYPIRPTRLTGNRQMESIEVGGSSWHHKFRFVPSYVALVIIIVSGFYMLSIEPRTRVVSRSTSSVSVLRETQVYENAINDRLKQSLIHQTKITINTRFLEQEIINTFPELQSVVIQIPLVGRRPTVNIVPAQPALIIAGFNDIYAADADGKLLLPTKDIPKGLTDNIALVRDESGTPLEAGQRILPNAEVSFIREVHHQLTSASIDIEALILPQVTSELHVRVRGEQAIIKLDLQRNPMTQVGTYLAVRNQLARQQISPSEYIDVRVSEKAFYR